MAIQALVTIYVNLCTMKQEHTDNIYYCAHSWNNVLIKIHGYEFVSAVASWLSLYYYMPSVCRASMYTYVICTVICYSLCAKQCVHFCVIFKSVMFWNDDNIIQFTITMSGMH